MFDQLDCINYDSCILIIYSRLKIKLVFVSQFFNIDKCGYTFFKYSKNVISLIQFVYISKLGVLYDVTY